MFETHLGGSTGRDRLPFWKRWKRRGKAKVYIGFLPTLLFHARDALIFLRGELCAKRRVRFVFCATGFPRGK